MGKTIRFAENSLIAIKNKLNEIMVGTDGVSHNDVYGNVKLYHGTDILALVKILKTNRVCASEGRQHGETHGMNWFSLENDGSFNRGACFSIEVPKADLDTVFHKMNNVHVVSKDSCLDISGYSPKVEYFCGHTRESLNNCYKILIGKGERYPIEWMRDEIFYKWCEMSGNEDTYMSVGDQDFGLIMANILGEEVVRKEGFLSEEVAKEFAPVASVGMEKGGGPGLYAHMDNEKPVEENMEKEVESSEVDLSSFKKRDTLPPGIWKDEETLNSKVRLKLLDIADDFWKFVNLTWVEPKGIIITGSICNFNWSKFSDIDLHLVVDFNEIDSKTEFVKQYLDSKKNEWNAEHEGLKIMGFPVELYTQDVSDNVEAGGIYDLEENAWIRRPNPHTIKSIGLEKFDIKRKAAEIMTIIDEMYKTLSSTDDGYEVSKIGEDASYLWEKVKSLRKKSLTKRGENGAGNIVYKVLRRTGYLDKLFKLFSATYDKSNSISESLIREEFDLLGAAKNFFGTTNDLRECGFILPDGSMLDLSGGQSGRRTVQHRSIESLENENTPTISLSRFVEAGAIRCDLRGGFINLIKRPTKEQIYVLSRFITKCGGCVQVDIGDDDISIDYVEYDGVNYRRIINDILNFFDNKIKPSSLYESKDPIAEGVQHVQKAGLSESTRKYLKILKEEFAMDGSSEGNPYEKRWKAERDALKNFVANYGKLMQSKEDNKMGRLYKVYYDETMSNLIGYNYCICVQWDEMTMKPKSTVYIRALDKFTPFIRRNLQFDNRGMDNQRGTYDDIRA